MLKLFELSVADRNLAILLPKVITDDAILLLIAIELLLSLSLIELAKIIVIVRVIVSLKLF